MAVFLFKVVDSSKDAFFVRAEGVDRDAAKADAVAKWEAWAAANTPSGIIAQRTLDATPDLICVASDTDQFSPVPWPNYVE